MLPQGAKGEEDTTKEVMQLEQENWQIERITLLSRKLGDADIVCISLKGRVYVIDVKFHWGRVVTDDKQLQINRGSVYKFEKGFLEQAMKQALRVNKQKKLDFVTPIVVCSNATVSVPAGELRRAYAIAQLGKKTLRQIHRIYMVYC